MKRIPELDAVRGIAALGIVMYHAYLTVFYLGWCFVDLFFVLSGYLITTIIIDNLGENGFLRAFYVRRTLRIWPVYYLTLVAVLALNSLSRTGYGTQSLAQHLVFLQNIQEYWGNHMPAFPAAFGCSWSVAIEEQFYLVWPSLLLFAGVQSIPVIVTLTLLTTVTARFLGFPYNILLGRADGLAFGCLLAFLAISPGRLRQLKRILAPLAIVSFGYICVLAYVSWRDPDPIWLTSTFFAFSLFFFTVVGYAICYTGHWSLAPLRSKWLGYLGLISYSLYLFHGPILQYVPPIAKAIHLPYGDVLKWPLVLLLPTLSYRYFEGPILKLKGRFEYRGGPQAAPKLSGSGHGSAERASVEIPIEPEKA